MFVQVILGSVTDRDGVRAALDDWVARLAPGADGWLGSTTGVADDGTFVAIARFASADAARRNSERPEQDAWWRETEKLFSGDVTFEESTDVVEMRGGGSDEARFVQVIRGRATDVERLRQMATEFNAVTDFRPDLLGSIAALHEGDRFTQAAYFTAEDAARGGESSEPPPELRARLEEQGTLLTDLSYVDLREPWLHSPG